MFKWLHPLAKPETLYRFCGHLFPWLMLSALTILLVGNVWGLVFAPQDYQQFDTVRIMYIHVPSALLSMSTYTMMAIAAFIALVWQVKVAQWSVLAIAPIGAVFTAISLLTGMAWGKPMWGTWWEWDARLTSQLILLFLYLGVIALYGAFSDRQTGGKVASLLAVIGVVNVPIIHFSVEWWHTLHQGASIMKFDTPSVHPSMLWPLLISLLGFYLLMLALVCLRLRTAILEHEQHRPWVRATLGGH
ncbi:MAG: heme ABC transporter permease [Alkalimonas sp.]|uniref:Heme exporter protein C n=1 Tax=Alkalimonas delamerensis TaxID=265981 RepID=A0ABT9GMQ4_9GAMM|nr:heme ABC transporter permease [Alkalimonas delamerensis]MCC5851286.1 heme ABC transporter permease [Alkalimonas sp.]MDP4528258.1 heme ABC transporter permease [Alkalimonas delamerensis]